MILNRNRTFNMTRTLHHYLQGKNHTDYAITTGMSSLATGVPSAMGTMTGTSLLATGTPSTTGASMGIDFGLVWGIRVEGREERDGRGGVEVEEVSVVVVFWLALSLLGWGRRNI